MELAAIGFALRIARAAVVGPARTTPRSNESPPILSAGREHDFVDSNWKFFRVMIDLGLMHCGVAVDAEKRNAYLDDIERFAIGNGWYRDGPIRSADHYIPFAFHFYGLIYAALSDDAKRAERYRARAAEFARSIRHWYAPDGSALPFGRSLTYRFAHAGFWGALAYAGVEALPWGQIKGYYLRNLRWWARQPIFDRDGVLSVGYAYPNLLMSEGYNSGRLALLGDEGLPAAGACRRPSVLGGTGRSARRRSTRPFRCRSRAWWRSTFPVTSWRWPRVRNTPVARHGGEVRQVRLFDPLRLFHRGQRPILSGSWRATECWAFPMTACICACAKATKRR